MRYTSVPGLAGLKDAVDSFKRSVNPLDVVVGFVAGAVGGQLISALITQKLGKPGADGKAMLDISQGFGAKLAEYGHSVGSLVTGGVLFAAQKGSNRASGHFVGAAVSAAIPVAAKAATYAFDIVKKPLGLSGYGEYVQFGQLRNDFGQLVNDPSQFGALYNDPYGEYVALPGSLGDLAATSAVTAESDEYNVY